MPNKITVTAASGPAVTSTATVINNVTNLNFNVAGGVLSITHDADIVTDYDLYGIATVTYTVASHLATVTVST